MFVPRQMDFAVLSVAELASAYVARKERVSRELVRKRQRKREKSIVDRRVSVFGMRITFARGQKSWLER